MKSEVLNRFSENTQISNFTTNRPVGAELFHAEERTDGRKDGRTETDKQNKANSPFSQFCKRA
jgi:hypothetical protein